MNRKLITFLSVLVILVFIGYMIFDSVKPAGSANVDVVDFPEEIIPDSWEVSNELAINIGSAKAVTVSPKGNVYIGGDSFILCLDSELKTIWNIKTPYPVTSLSVSGDSIFASSMELILVFNSDGDMLEEWGPFEDEALITSVTSNKSYVAFADAGNKIVFVLEKNGVVKSQIGQSGEKFIIPSPYFDIALSDANTLLIANTGNRRLETRKITGELESYFGEAGTAPGAFCGCCNPAHFIVVPQGFVTAEKGLNRIKIINSEGDFTEYVTSNNKFTPSVPLDLASADGKTIYALNPQESKLYVYNHK